MYFWIEHIHVRHGHLVTIMPAFPFIHNAFIQLHRLQNFQLTPCSQSDHPVVNSRYLLHEAAQAHYYGLDPALALLSVTHTPAMAMGMGHRVGMLKPGTRSCSLCTA
jgi:hypothetical protein